MQSNLKVSVLLLCTSAFALSVAAATTLREGVNVVTVSDTLAEAGHPLAANSAIARSRFVHTGVESRADINRGQATLRLGAKSAMQINDAAGRVRLHRGTVLYDHLAGTDPLVVTLGEIQVSISGGAGFVHLKPAGEAAPESLNIGALGEETTVRVGGEKYTLDPSDLLVVSSEGRVLAASFDLNKQVRSSQLINGFKKPLPSLARIQSERDRFVSLQKRGFIHELANAEVAAVHDQGGLEAPQTTVAGESPQQSFQASAQAVRGHARSLIGPGAKEGLDLGSANVVNRELQAWHSCCHFLCAFLLRRRFGSRIRIQTPIQRVLD